MGRLLTGCLVACAMLPPAAWSQVPSRQQFTAGIDLSLVNTSGLESWTEGSVGKLRYDEDGLALSRAFLDYRGGVADTVDVAVAVEIYDDGLGSPLDVTEAYLEWRPVPSSANRYGIKAGAFYPRISFENTGPGWGSPYVLTSSTINTWVAEEVRTVGAEFSWTRRLSTPGVRHEFGVQMAAYVANDPTGALLTWKGWSAHDRQSRFSDRLPLPLLPQIQPGGVLESQAPYTTPFREVDHRIGYYINAEWRIGNRLQARAMRYDNRADPEAVRNGQYGWYTEFNHLGLKAALPGDVGLIAQWMGGTTVMGSPTGDIYPVDVEYDSRFVLLTRSFDAHRLSLRYENFHAGDRDMTPDDDNSEAGLAWTASWRYRFSDRLAVATEWLSIKTSRASWAYFDLGPTATEQQLQLSLLLRFAR
jgi:hypothetical protein